MVARFGFFGVPMANASDVLHIARDLLALFLSMSPSSHPRPFRPPPNAPPTSVASFGSHGPRRTMSARSAVSTALVRHVSFPTTRHYAKRGAHATPMDAPSRWAPVGTPPVPNASHTVPGGALSRSMRPSGPHAASSALNRSAPYSLSHRSLHLSAPIAPSIAITLSALSLATTRVPFRP
jgi:hypothetical protein